MSQTAAADTSAARSLPELLLPAGDVQRLRFSLRYGADAVYLGAAGLSMRPDQVAFSLDELEQAVALTHAADKRVYVATNILLSEDELEALRKWLLATRHIPFDALIVSDLGAIALARELRPELALHVSTQLSTANHQAARLLASLGVKRVVLARECSLTDTRRVVADGGLEVEIFVHGAMCVAVSGRCLLSAHLSGKSGNKGECKHSCRWEWQLVEQKRPGESLPIFEEGQRTFLMGSRDLCLIEHLPEVVATGVHALKVEGRMKSAYYVATVGRAYRAALDSYARDPSGYRFDERWLDELTAVSHRPFSTGFAFGYPQNAPQTLQTHNHPVSSRQLVAYVDAIGDERLFVRVKNPISPGDELEWVGPGATSGALVVDALWDETGAPIERAISATVVQLGLRKVEGIMPRVDSIIRRHS